MSESKHMIKGSFVIGYDFSAPNDGVLLVGIKHIDEHATISNALEGEEAWKIFLKLKHKL